MNETSQQIAVAAEQTLASEVQPTKSGWDNIEEIGGVSFSFFGMSVVFFGLLATFLFISIIPYVVGVKKFAKAPKKREKPPSTEQANASATSSNNEDKDLQAAIAYVIAAEHEYEMMTDYTKMTIRRDEDQQIWGVAGKMRSLATRKISIKR